MNNAGVAPIDGAEAEAAQQAFFLELLKVRIEEVGDGAAKLALDVDRRHLRNLGIMHGGVLCTLLDSVMGIAAHTEVPDDHYTVTAQLNVNFIRPAWEGETLEAHGQVQHRGRQTAIARAEVRTATGTLVGAGSATFMYVRHTEKTRGKVERLPDSSCQTDPQTAS